MRDTIQVGLLLAFVLLGTMTAAQGQEPAAGQGAETQQETTPETQASETDQPAPDETSSQTGDESSAPQPENTLEEKAKQTVESAKDTAAAAAEALEKDERVKQVSAGILKPIYMLAELFAFPAFYWIAFAAMVTGSVSFALQLTLGKLVVLSRLGFSIAEILSDLLGLSVSLIGLVLTTQAATENSTFPQSATAVLSATAVGVVLGFFFYVWGQRQELQAVAGRKAQARSNDER